MNLSVTDWYTIAQTPVKCNDIKISADSPSLISVSEQGVEQTWKWKHSQISYECS